MSAFIIRPNTKKDAEIAEAVLRKMRIPVEKIGYADASDDDEVTVPFSVFAAELDRRIRKHFKMQDDAGAGRKKSALQN